MSFQKQPKLLVLIYALLAVLAGTFLVLLYLSPWTVGTVPTSIRCDTDLAQSELALRNGNITEAERLCISALKLSEAGSDLFQRARVLDALGLVYRQERKLKAAEKSLGKALNCLNQLITQNSTVTAKKLPLDKVREIQQKYSVIEGDLASVLSDCSRYGEAESAYQEALKRNDLSLGSMEVQRRLQHDLQKVLLKEGKTKAAEMIEIDAAANDLTAIDLSKALDREVDLVRKGIQPAKSILKLKAIALAAERMQKEDQKEIALRYMGIAQLGCDQVHDAEATQSFKRALKANYSAAVSALIDCVDESINNKKFPLARQLSEQLAELTSDTKSQSIKQHLRQLSWRLRLCGNHCYNAGKYTDAETLFRGSLAIYKIIDTTDRDMADVFKAIADSCTSSGKYKEGEPFYMQSLAIYERTKGADKQLIWNLHALAGNYESQGKYKNAEEICKRAVTILDKLPAPNAELPVLVSKLAHEKRMQGHYLEAEPFFKKALQLYEKQKAADSYEFADSLREIGVDYQLLGKDREAAAMFKRALKIYENKKVDNLPMAYALDGLSDSYQHQNRDSEAEPMRKRALLIVEKINGPDDIQVAHHLRALAQNYCSQGKYAEAKTVLEKALPIFRKTKGDGSVEVTSVQGLLADNQAKIGK